MTTKKTTAKKTEAKPKKADPRPKLAKEMKGLLSEMQGLGLLKTEVVEKLESKTEEVLTGTLGEGFSKAASWERALAGELENFSSAGGDGNVKSQHEALLVWQRSLAEVPISTDGLQQAVATLKKVVPYSGATLYLRDPQVGRVVPLLDVNFRVDLISRIKFDEGGGFSAWVASRKKPVLYSSIHRNEAPREDQVRSFMSVPMIVGGQCVGVLSLGHGTENAYQQATLRTLILAASMISGLVYACLAGRHIAALKITDSVTGCYTEEHWMSRLREEVVRCRELGYSMSIISLGLNEIKEHAARFGQSYMDRCLTDLGELTQAARQEPELVGRAGDRLWILMPGAVKGQAEDRAREWADGFEAHSFPRRKRMTVTYSVASYPADAEEAQELLNYAENDWESKWREQKRLVPETSTTV